MTPGAAYLLEVCLASHMDSFAIGLGTVIGGALSIGVLLGSALAWGLGIVLVLIWVCQCLFPVLRAE